MRNDLLLLLLLLVVEVVVVFFFFFGELWRCFLYYQDMNPNPTSYIFLAKLANSLEVWFYCTRTHVNLSILSMVNTVTKFRTHGTAG